MTAQDKDRIECAIRHIQTAVDVDPWAVEIAVEAMKAQLSREDTTSDPISRQAALDALIALTVYSNKRDLVKEADNHPNTWIEGVAECIDEIEDMPSAHPEIEERKEESAQNVPKEDLISRNAAIDYCYALINAENPSDPSDEWNYSQERINQTEVILHHLEFMPSAQPEPCEDAVSREAAIDAALSAFSRGLLASPDIRKLPSVTPKPQWIPCKERLPEEDHWLGGSGKQFSDNVLISILNSDDEDEWVDVSYTIDGEWTLELPRYCKILAWMPLPEPYRAERRTDGRD